MEDIKAMFLNVIQSTPAADYLIDNIKQDSSLYEVNELLKQQCGINVFFETETELSLLISELHLTKTMIVAEDRADYGDFQTNEQLATKIVQKLRICGVDPQIVIEPTCGKGHFIVAALKNFKRIERIFGIEIYKPYVWQTKFDILNYFLQNPSKEKPEITIFHHDFFNFDFSIIKQYTTNKNVLILGNPPWVTNAQLSVFESNNLPQKSNFKNQKGLDAMTGKGNFDISEYITIKLLQFFGHCVGYMAFLLKNTVIKNIIYEQNRAKLPITAIQKQNIDSRKEFNVAVDASLLFCKLNSCYSVICEESDFYTSKVKNLLGWHNNKFLSAITDNVLIEMIDGLCPFEWRQGVKHDCSKVMELEKINNQYFRNKLGEEFALEDDLIYGLLKSSDLKQTAIETSRKYTIITQTNVGQNTDYIKQYPQTYNYLKSHINYFDRRKSIIYKNKPNFAIFGIGDYAFKPYKVAISGLYKTFHFTLVMPQNGKPIMLDDTCYFLGFDTVEQAKIVLKLLNNKITTQFLQSIVFVDSKRIITKDSLMRIDLRKIATYLAQENKADHKLCALFDNNFTFTKQTQLSLSF